jgi:molybdenum cofactor biosynthesis enzyme MoaA
MSRDASQNSLKSDKINLSEQLQFGKPFCPLPFISYHTDVNKKRKLCCLSNHSVTDARIKEIRTDILNEKEVLECATCYKHENLKLISRRQQQLKDWLLHKDTLVEAIDNHKKGNNIDYVDYDLRYSNLCNLECQTCNATDSSMIALKQGKPLPFLQYEPNLKINNFAKRIYFAGGEPFLIKSFSQILNSLENKDCEIIINTNATTLTKHMLSALDKFNNINFTVSIDGFGKLNDQIRKHSCWEEIENNLEILTNRYGGYDKILINTVVQKDNVNHLLELGNWIMSKKIKLWRLTLLKTPEKFYFSHCDNVNIPNELLKLPIIQSSIENSKVLKYIKDHANYQQ